MKIFNITPVNITAPKIGKASLYSSKGSLNDDENKKMKAPSQTDGEPVKSQKPDPQTNINGNEADS
jgi:hypothetical protein